MIYSNERKRCLSGWLKQNHNKEYNSPLKLQKFLLLYECFTKISGETPDLEHLRGYKRGPVFSQVWEDYTKEREDFDRAVDESYSSEKYAIQEEWAKKAAFIVSILSEKELSELTHSMNLWKSKEDRILRGERQVELDEKDFNENDSKIISALNKMYPIDLINDSHIEEIDNVYFVMHKKDFPKLTAQHFDVLSSLTENGSLVNPVYVDIDEGGQLIID